MFVLTARLLHWKSSVSPGNMFKPCCFCFRYLLYLLSMVVTKPIGGTLNAYLSDWCKPWSLPRVT